MNRQYKAVLISFLLFMHFSCLFMSSFRMPGVETHVNLETSFLVQLFFAVTDWNKNSLSWGKTQTDGAFIPDLIQL